MSTAATGIPRYLHGLIDDAAIFPPGNAPLDRALADHSRHRAAPYADLIGPFVVSDTRLPDLLDLVGDGPPLAVSVVVTGGAGAIEGAVRWATRSGRLEVRAVETSLRDEGDLPRNAARVVAAVDQVLDELGDAVVHVEPPMPHDPTTSWFQALDVVAEAGHALKFRTGGVEADLFRDSSVIATCIDAALDRETPFKCTAGLHHALPWFDDRLGVWHHGFLGILLGTRAALDGGDAAAVIAARDPDEVVRLVGQAGDEALASARRWFTSFGCCSVLEPRDDLVALGLMQA